MEQKQIETACGVITLPVLDEEAASKLQVTWHWSASTYSVGKLLLEHYHFILDRDGRVHQGVPLERNVATKTHLREAGYAAHVKHANSNNIGVAAAAMAGASEAEARQGRYGKYPLTARQADGLVEIAAQLCAHYGIPVLPARVLGHEEWDSVLGYPQDRWDVNCLPHLDLRPRMLGDGTYESTNLLRRLTQQRVLQLSSGAHAGAGSAGEMKPDKRQLQAFARFIAFYDAAVAAQFPAETLRLIRQLRDAVPLGSFSRDDLKRGAGYGDNDAKPGR